MVGLGRIGGAALLVLALGAAAGPAAGQQELLGPGAAFFGIGASGIATGELDDRLEARGYPTFGQEAVAVSLGAYRVMSRGLTLGAEWHGLIIGEEEHQGREVGIGGGYGTLGLGYLVDLSPRARLHPRLGVGGGGMGLWIESEEPEVGFDEVLADPEPVENRGTVLSRGSGVIDLGLGAELFTRASGRGALLGLRVGYLATPFGTDWLRDEAPLSNAPGGSIAGPYLRVVIGLGWR